MRRLREADAAGRAPRREVAHLLGTTVRLPSFPEPPQGVARRDWPQRTVRQQRAGAVSPVTDHALSLTLGRLRLTEAKVNNPNKNPDCDSDKCRYSRGEVRIYPGGHPPLTLCATCWAHESARRRFKTGLPVLKWAEGKPISALSSYTD